MSKDSKLIIHTTNPLNAEPPLDVLRENFITPQDSFFLRNHGDIPEIDSQQYRLRVNGMVEHPLEWSFDKLKEFPKHTVMATIQCAGNRRDELIAVAPTPGELPWYAGAIGNAIWSGVPLKEVLNAAGVMSGARYVAFTGADDVFRQGENVGFGSSIPIDKAWSNDVLLAYEMNGKPLEPTHGFPVRVVVPGYIGARSVKWLTEITLQTEPSKNYFQDHAYRLFPPEANAETVDWNSGLQLSDLTVNCVITSPLKGSVLPAANITVKGYAISGCGRKIVRIEASTDGGKTWTSATITEGNQPWAWAFWEVDLQLDNTGAAMSGKEYEIIARAFDSDSNTQPETPQQVWNFKGYMNNAWHRVKVKIK